MTVARMIDSRADDAGTASTDIQSPRWTVRGWLTDSRPMSLGIACAGALSLAIVIVGGVVWLAVSGLTPVDSLSSALQSSGFRGLMIAGIVIGLVAAVGGGLSYRAMPTKASREQAIGGPVLGMQAIILGAVLGWFSLFGDVSLFVRNFLDFDVLAPYADAFVNGLKNTAFLSLIGFGLGIILGLLVSLAAVSQRALVRAPARVFINFFRGTPLIWQIAMIYFGFALGLKIGLGPYTAAIAAFALNVAAYCAEIFRAGLQSVQPGQLNAARGLGMSYLSAMRYAVVPQAVRNVIPPLMNQFVSLVKDTSLVLILGLTVGQRELFTTGQEIYNSTFNATFFVITGLAYLVITLPMMSIVKAVEKRMRSGLVGGVGS